ncbi:isocitrate lyase/phosphoenolpyruvate mutase family protein [Nocardia asteroides]|uniref:isocitrate lyase/PEP mutase family protein n=1 Tax=Nocardia asteroides TaxID=1824 RepID=UPI003415F0AE
MISDPQLVRELLRTAPMPPVPEASGPGIAWLRVQVPRFCDGPDHLRRRAAVQRELDRIDPVALRAAAAARGGQPLAHVRTLLHALDLPEDAAGTVATIAAAYQPHEPITPAADAAVAELVALCRASAHSGTASECPDPVNGVPVPGVRDGRRIGSEEAGRVGTPQSGDCAGGLGWADASAAGEADWVVARICLLVQACAGTGALIAAGRAMPGEAPTRIMATAAPVRSTRRMVEGEVTELDLRYPGLGFGAGPHRCPGAEHGLALAAGVLEAERRNGMPERSSGRHPLNTPSFHDLHAGDTPLILPNAWDFTSGALLVDAGFAAIATTSLGVAAAAGLPDGKAASKEETYRLATRLVRLPAPVSVDVEAGFADDPAEVADFVARLADLGVAGINIEDGRANTALAAPEQQAQLIRAVKDRAPRIFVNARVDTYWFGLDQESTLRRARLYAAAGADGLFVPGVTDPATVSALVAATPLPLNTLYAPAGPDIGTLAALGVRRISTGSALYRAALGAAVGLARTLRGETGDLSGAPDYRRIQALLDR